MSRLTRNQRRRASELRDQINKAFPNCFMPRGGTAKRPLKCGIDRDLAAALPDLTRQDVWIVLTDYTSGATYLRSMVEGASRIGLDGAETGEIVTPEAARKARVLLLSQLHKPFILDLVGAMDLLLPLVRESRDSLVESSSRLDADLNPIPGTVDDEIQPHVTEMETAIGKADAVLAQVRELLR